MSYSTIKFGDNLIKNKTCTITYSGTLFENNSEFVNIVYGFGNEWHHTKEQEMEKTENGFVAEVNMLDYDTFNFCFRNSNYEWDNNNNQNYTSPITEEIPEEINFIINDDSVISNIIDNLCQIDVSIANDKVIQTIEVPSTLENVNTVDIVENNEIEPVVTEESAPFEIEIETNTPVNIEDSLVNITEAETLDSDIENIFNDIYQEAVSNENTVEENNSFNMNSLIDEILSPVVKSTVFDEETDIDNSLADVSTNLFEDLDNLDEDFTLDNKIDSLITDLFNNTKAFAESKKIQELNLNEAEITKAIDEKIEEILSETPIITEKISQIEPIVNEPIVQETVNKKVPDFTIIEDDEVTESSLLEEVNTSNNETALIEVNTEDDLVVSTRGLRKFYMFKKKVKLAFTKLFVTLPKLFAKGFNTENN